MSDSKFEVLRRHLPLDAQIGYGKLKYTVKPRPHWGDNDFIRYSAWLDNTQWWSRSKLENFQLENLQALVKHAYENVPYYRRVFDQIKLKPQDIASLDDIQKIPLLRREDISKNLEDMVARNYDRSRLRLITTGGTTGKPLGVYQDKYTVDVNEMVYVIRQWNWAGYELGDRIVTLRGNTILRKSTQGKRAWWDYNPGHNELILSSFEMDDDHLFKYIEIIQKFQPRFIQAYPSSIEIFARFMKRNSICSPSIEAIFCESETLYPEQRKLIESQFGCKIFSGYGMTERAADAVECEQHQGYHVNMEYGILELVDRFNQPIKMPGISGRVVGTGFDTFCMPIIRYVTDDIAEYGPDICKCTRQATLVKNFKGRLRELIFSKSGKIMPLMTCLSLHGNSFVKLSELKFIQEREGELIVQIAVAPNYSETEVRAELQHELYQKLHPDEFVIKIDVVKHVKRTERGKIGILEQRIPIKAEYMDAIGNPCSNACTS